MANAGVIYPSLPGGCPAGSAYIYVGPKPGSTLPPGTWQFNGFGNYPTLVWVPVSPMAPFRVTFNGVDYTPPSPLYVNQSWYIAL